MAKYLILALGLLFSLNCAFGAPLDETYGYYNIRTGSHMFYVLYETDSELGGNWTDYPLIMWLQGGPCSSSVGYGNFWELGPYFINQTLRPWRWTQKGNLLFPDQPVGTGYSYVDDPSFLTTTNQEIADDLVTFTIMLFNDIPELQTMPFYVYSESYGGKMTIDYAIALQAAIDRGDIICDFQAVGLGDSWISPMDSVNTWGSFLYSVGYVSEKEKQAIDDQAAVTQQAVDEGRWEDATDEWGTTELVVLQETGGISFYNVFLTTQVYSRSAEDHGKDVSFMRPSVKMLYENHVLPFEFPESRDELDDYMNGPQAQAWGIPDNVTWGGQSGICFNAQDGDFMKPVVDSVVYVLENTNLHVDVYTGDWDLICDTPGTYNWVEAMNWTDRDGFMAAERVAVDIPSYTPWSGYYQRYNQFSLWTFLRAGHMVPMDAPQMCLDMMDQVAEWAQEAKVKGQAKKAAKAKAGKPKSEEEKLEEEITLLREQVVEYKKHETEEKKEKEAVHMEAPHKEAPHKEAPHKEASHMEAPHKEAPHKEAPHKETPSQNKEEAIQKILHQTNLDKHEEHKAAPHHAAHPRHQRHHGRHH